MEFLVDNKLQKQAIKTKHNFKKFLKNNKQLEIIIPSLFVSLFKTKTVEQSIVHLVINTSFCVFISDQAVRTKSAVYIWHSNVVHVHPHKA